MERLWSTFWPKAESRLTSDKGGHSQGDVKRQLDLKRSRPYRSVSKKPVGPLEVCGRIAIQSPI